MQLLVERLDHDPEAAAAENFLDVVMRQTAHRAGFVRRLQKAQGALDIFAALVTLRLGHRRVLARDPVDLLANPSEHHS